MPETTKVNYKKTLNLPRTGFAMRADLVASEPRTLARWEQERLYEQVIAARQGAKPYAFHDGPPYANGMIHVGHLLNKVLKDVVVRSRLMEGRLCPYIPGWDCHGLPIEHKVMTELVSSGGMKELERLGEDQRRMAVRRRCAEYAKKFVKLQAGQMKRLLTLADYEHPYLTMTPDYEAAVLEVFAQLLEQGLVYRALKSVHWSIENQTALAEAELEYHDRTDTAIYVDFEAADRDAVARAFGVELDRTPSFMIWTTTPWTLPANLAIAVHERFRYALVQVDGSITVIARELVERVTRAAGSGPFEVLGEAEGSSLVGLTYRQPLTGAVCPVVKADYVTLEDGTGLVHTAPGHGAEDNLTAVREGLEIYCPVRGDGTYDDTVPEWLQGMGIWDANPRIVTHLRESGHLFFEHPYTHSYPHDWRSHTPVIFRATEQWFIAVDRATGHGGGTLRDLALDACDRTVRFVPEWGRNRMRGMLESRPDWCISRQRAWGLPIPAFRLPGGEVLLTAASVRAVAAVFAQRGSDAWFTEPPEKLLAGYKLASDPEAPAKSIDAARLVKMYDIFDVWFESGSSWNAVMRARGQGYPCDLYLEGSDQHRGFFQLSLLPALGATGVAPFKALLTHGFTVDKEGRKMSKSLGNALEVDDLLAKYGADVCRWWVSSLAFENDVKVGPEFFDLAGEGYRKVRNTLRFLLSNLADYAQAPPQRGRRAAVDDLATAIEPTSIHAWVVGAAADLSVQVRAAYEEFAFRRVHQLLYDFCNETLSALYCDAVKDRLYCDRPAAPRRRVTQMVMWELAEILCRLLAPLLPHTADEAYRALWEPVEGAGAAGRCAHLERFLDLPRAAADPGWAAVMALRDSARRALEQAKARGIDNALDAEVVAPDPEGALAPFLGDLADVLGVSRVRLTPGAPGTGELSITDLRDEPRCDRCWRRDPTTAPRRDGGTLCDRCADAVGV